MDVGGVVSRIRVGRGKRGQQHHHSDYGYFHRFPHHVAADIAQYILIPVLRMSRLNDVAGENVNLQSFDPENMLCLRAR